MKSAGKGGKRISSRRNRNFHLLLDLIFFGDSHRNTFSIKNIPFGVTTSHAISGVSEVVRIDSLHLVVRCGRNPDAVIEHQLR